MATGAWNGAADHPSGESTSWHVVLVVEIVVVVIAGVAGLASLAALVLGVALAG